MKPTLTIPALFLSTMLIGCGEEGHGHSHEGDDHGHPHHSGDAESHDKKVPLGTFKAGEIEIKAAQGHGMVAAGKEGHLVINLPYKDKGATVIRAWIGTEDRTLSAVGKGGYTAKTDSYDIHAVAPSPLPADAKWWVEIVKPDGTKVVGSVAPKM